VFQIQIISIFYLSGIFCAFFYLIDHWCLSHDRSNSNALELSKAGGMDLSVGAMEDILSHLETNHSSLDGNPMHDKVSIGSK
jgi:hypothetical protein